MRSPLISVVIPTYNYGRFVAEAVESALAQTYPACEVIVIDDGSTDDTRERLLPYMDRLRYIDQDNRGLSAARNAGIEAARGEWIALLDSDDVWHPRKLEVQAAFLTEHPGVGLLAAGHAEFDGDCRFTIDVPDRPPTRAVSFEDLVLRSRFGACGVVVRRRCFEEVGLFDTSFRSAEDRDMWIRIAAMHPVVLMPAPLWGYRIHAGSMSHVSIRMEENEARVLRKVFPPGTRLPARTRRLRHHAYSLAACSAAYMHDVAGLRPRALERLARSFLMWPMPYRADDAPVAFVRPKLLVRIARNLLGSSS